MHGCFFRPLSFFPPVSLAPDLCALEWKCTDRSQLEAARSLGTRGKVKVSEHIIPLLINTALTATRRRLYYTRDGRRLPFQPPDASKEAGPSIRGRLRALRTHLK